MQGLDRNEMINALKRKGQRMVPLKWDDFSPNYINANKAKMTSLWETYGKDYVFVLSNPLEKDILFDEIAREWDDEWGIRWRTQDKNEYGGYAAKHCYKNVEEASALSLPDLDINTRLAPIIQARLENPDKFLWVQFWLGPFEIIRGLVGEEELLTALCLKPNICSVLIEKVYEFFNQVIAAISKLDVDMIGIADDWGTERNMLISPNTWVELFEKHYAKIYNTIKSYGKLAFFHSCGHVMPLYSRLIDMGVDVLNPIQPGPMDIKKVAREFKGKVSFFGGLDTRQLLGQDKPENVEKAVINLIDTLGQPEGGLVVGHCTSVHNPTPVENIEAMFKATRNYEFK